MDPYERLARWVASVREGALSDAARSDDGRKDRLNAAALRLGRVAPHGLDLAKLESELVETACGAAGMDLKTAREVVRTALRDAARKGPADLPPDLALALAGIDYRPQPMTAPDAGWEGLDSEGPRPRPPEDELRRLWRSAVPVTDEGKVAAWLDGRGFDVSEVARLELARALPPGSDSDIRWAYGDGGKWTAKGFRCVLPAFEPDGRFASLWARTVVPGAQPKGLAPSLGRGSRKGLALADAGARRMLRGEGLSGALWVTEGETDWLTVSTGRPLPDRGLPPSAAVLGIVSGSWTADLADRIPDGAVVVLACDPDPSGVNYHRRIRESLDGRSVTVHQYTRPEDHPHDLTDLANMMNNQEDPRPEPPPVEAVRESRGIDLTPVSPADLMGWARSNPPPPSCLLWDTRPNGSGARAPYLTDGGVGLLNAPGGTGKSWLLWQLAASVATGQKWLGTFDVDTPGRVWLIGAEDDPANAHRRFKAVADLVTKGLDDRERSKRFALLARRLRPVPAYGMQNTMIDGAGGGPFLNELLRRLREDDESCEPVRLVIFDPAARFMAPDVENDNGKANVWLSLLERLATELPGRPAVLLAHHTPKGADLRSQDAARGSSALVNNARWVANFGAAKPNDDPTLRVVKVNNIPTGAELVLHQDEKTGVFNPGKSAASRTGRPDRPGF